MTFSYDNLLAMHQALGFVLDEDGLDEDFGQDLRDVLGKIEGLIADAESRLS